jgi:hypothetical protein
LWEKKSCFLDIWIKSYGCLKFLGEVWVGRACAGANEEELTKQKFFWGQRRGGNGTGGWKNGGPAGRGRAPRGRPLVADSPVAARAVTGGRPLVHGLPGHGDLFLIFFVVTFFL